MADLKKIDDYFVPIELNYMGDILYKRDSFTFSTGEQFIIKDGLKNPKAINISKDVCSILTDNYKNTDIFNDIRDEKQGVGDSFLELSALAQNHYTSQELLSATAETDAYTSIIAMSDIQGTDDFTNLVNYSFNTTVKISDSNIFWNYNTGELSSISNPSVLTDDNFFYFKFLDGIFCNIIKQNSNGIEYLTFDILDNTVKFKSVEDLIYSRFYYSYNSKENRIFISVQNDKGILGFTNSGEISAVSYNSIVSELQNTFEVDFKNQLNQNQNIKNSFLPLYGNKNNIQNTHDVDNIGIITHNYSSLINTNSNYITLKSNQIYDEINSLISIDQNVFFRNYSSINSGIRGDSGYNNYILSYNINDYKYDFKPDKQTYFNIPFDLRGYTQININDCKLVDNGAIGGNSPLNSDKIYKKLYEYSDFKNTGKTSNVDNAKYLCSWLCYNPLYPSQSLWLDRYYNPDVVTKLDALSEDGWDNIKNLLSFSKDNNLAGAYEEYYNEFDKTQGVFDVVSKLTIEENSLYMYERIGSNSSIELLEDKNIFQLVNKNNEKMDYSNSFYLLTNNTSNDEDFTVNIALKDFDLEQSKGNKIFGNRSFSLSFDKNYSPYVLSVENTKINYYDFDYNFITSLDLSSTIDDIIFTDDYNKFFADCNGVIYTIENLDFITNETTTLSSFNNISDIKYYDQKLYTIDSVSNEISSYSPDLDELSYIKLADSNDDLLVNISGDIKTGEGDYIDYGDSSDKYVLSSNNVFYEDISTPIISSDNIIDFYIISNDKIFILKNDSLHKIDNEYITKTEKSINITPSYGLSSMDLIRYQRNGEELLYLDVIDTDGSNNIIRRYNTDLELQDTLTRTINGNIIKTKKLFNTKYLTKQLQFKVTLYDIFNYHKKGDIELTIDSKYIDESENPIINIVFSNQYGTITTYCNSKLIDIFKFDNEKYYFSNTLRDNKIFVSSSILNDENTIDSLVLSSNNDMVSGGYTIENISIYNDNFNYFDIINYNRIYKGVSDSSLVIPIRTRAFIEEISGFYTQNKNIRKSEYGSITIRGTELTDNMKIDVKNKIDKTFDDTFINLKISETNFK